MNSQEWHTGICECCCASGCGLCCIACFAPCFVFGENYRLLKTLNSKHTSTFMDSMSCLKTCNDQTLATWVYGIPWTLGIVGTVIASVMENWISTPFSIISCIAFLAQCQVRGVIREASGMPPDCCCDCCESSFCYACALEQERQQLNHLIATKENLAPMVQAPPKTSQHMMY